jgi:hypothetical protein
MWATSYVPTCLYNITASSSYSFWP